MFYLDVMVFLIMNVSFCDRYYERQVGYRKPPSVVFEGLADCHDDFFELVLIIHGITTISLHKCMTTWLDMLT